MASTSTFVAPFAVTHNTCKLEEQVSFYSRAGYHYDASFNVKDLPSSYLFARSSPAGKDSRMVCLRLAGDPYMHLILREVPPETQPDHLNRIGPVSISLLVEDVAAELQRIKEAFGCTVVQELVHVNRAWGKTTTAFIRDPSDTLVELVAVEGPSFDAKTVKSPTFQQTSWLHFMYNAAPGRFQATRDFYEALGMRHDPGVDLRPNVGYGPFGAEKMGQQMSEGVKLVPGSIINNAFVRGPRDPSTMHIEILDYTEGYLAKDRDSSPWLRRPIARYCYRVADYAAELRKAKEAGVQVLVDDQRACLNWGDSQWCFLADPEGHIVTFEQWYPHRYWGEAE